MKYLLGIDAGTSVVKSVVFDFSGNEITVAKRDTPLEHPFLNASEGDMGTLWQLTTETIREVSSKIDTKEIAAVGIAGTACGVWAVDKNLQPLRKAIFWNDGRAADVIAHWQDSGFFKRSFEISGNAAFPGYPLSALSWLKENEEKTLEQAHYLLFHKDWLRLQLTGEIATDISDVGYFPGDIRKRLHSTELLQSAGLEISNKLPSPHESSTVVGHITRQAAKQTGLKEGTPVIAGAVDVIASLIGGGVVKAGQAGSVLGTSFLNSLVSTQPTFQPGNTGVQTCMPDGLWVRSLVNTTGTLAIEWMLETIAQDVTGENRYDTLSGLAQSSPVGSRGLIFLPYLSTAGIISPFANAQARGQFFGLSTEHGRAEMIRAVYEGLALAMRDCYSVMEQNVKSVVVVGGGARSQFLMQLFADVTGKQILVTNGTEFGARGVALLAGVGAGIFESLEQAVKECVRIERSYEPNLENTNVYTELYKLYRHLYQHATDAWSLRQEILSHLPIERSL
jgi:sugar (pentulose or hexulose) kinase